MNLNKKIAKFTGDGIEEYNRKFNELIEAVNWLNGIRTLNGRAISESDQGPVIDLSQVNTTQTGSDASGKDPDGNQAGWRKITLIDPSTGQFEDLWAWTGSALSNIRQVPWWFDESSIQAHWLSGPQGELWGTGSYPIGGSAKYQQLKWFNSNATWPYAPSPAQWNGNVQNTPIVPPSSGPVLFIKAYVNAVTYDYSTPYLSVWDPNIGGPAPSLNFNLTYQFKYEGTTFLSGSASGNFTEPRVFVPIDKTGWVFDPQGVPGYTYGDKCWLYIYNGAISSNTNPTVEQIFTYTTNAGNDLYPDIYSGLLYTG